MMQILRAAGMGVFVLAAGLASQSQANPVAPPKETRGEAKAAASDQTVGSVYGRYASLRDLGYKELACRLEASVKRFDAKKATVEKPGEKVQDKTDAESLLPTAEALNDALKATTLTMSMKPAECAISDAPASAQAHGSGADALKTQRLARSVAEALQAQCAKLSLHYFRHPLADYGKDHKLKNEGGWYRLTFASGDYKLTAFVSPDLRTMREYSDGKDNLTDLLFRQEGEKLAPAMISVKTPGKTVRMDGLSYELKKGVPVLAGYRATIDDAEHAQEILAKLSNCRLLN